MLSLLWQEPILFFAWLLAIVIALSVHEFSHALAGTLLGDETAKRMGRLTLNPLAHIDPLGFLALVTVGFGWGRPVPYNPYNLRNQKWGPVLVALAGPAMNLLFAIVFGTTYRLVSPFLGADNLLIQFLMLAAYLNLALLLFNLIPLPPLDGSKLLIALVQDRPYGNRIRFWLESRGPWVLVGIIIADAIFNLGIFSWLFDLVTGILRIFGMSF